jgi:hypothetical protein
MACKFLAMSIVLATTFPASAAMFPDELDDTFPTSPGLAMDMAGLEVEVSGGELHLTIIMDPSYSQDDLFFNLNGIVDFDTDLDPSTGQPANVERFGHGTISNFGADLIIAFAQFGAPAQLSEVQGNVVEALSYHSVSYSDNTLSVSFPFPDVDAFGTIALVGNGGFYTDAAPNGDSFFIVPEPSTCLMGLLCMIPLWGRR